MIFWRIIDNKLHAINDTDNLGFEESEGLRIPDEYLKQKKFMVLRASDGIGDWGIISAIPRLLKEKYSDCQVLVPSKNYLKNLFGKDHDNVHVIFNNNPYVDKFVDEVSGEVFHDHYRIYDKNNTDIPLAKQILKFWQFSDKEMSDCQPEMYWSEEEKEFGDKIINHYVDGDFGFLLVSKRFGTQFGKHHQESYDKDTKVMTEVLKDNPLPYFYWTHKPLRETEFSFINSALDMRNINLRIQLYIKSKAKINLANQCGVNHSIVRYSECYESQRQFPISHNYISGVNYI